MDSPSTRPLVKDIVELLIAAGCGAGRSLQSILSIPQFAQCPIYVGTADIPEPIESSVYDAEAHNFQELGPLATIISSTAQRYRIDPTPISEARRFLQSRRLDPDLPLFILYIYVEVSFSVFHVLDVLETYVRMILLA